MIDPENSIQILTFGLLITLTLYIISFTLDAKRLVVSSFITALILAALLMVFQKHSDNAGPGL